MKYTFLAVALLASAAALACDERGMSMDRLTQELNLAPEQATQVEQILKAGHERARTEHEKMRTQMEAIHEDTLNQLRGVLTDDQIKTLESHWQEHQGWHGHHAPDAGENAQGA